MAKFDEVFERDNAGRINGFVADATERLLHSPGFRDIGLNFELLSPATRSPSGETMMLQMSPASAMRFAALVLDLAKERGWEMPQSNYEDVPGNPKGLN